MKPSSEQLKYMVDRFLTWKLPDTFNPDGGITFKKTYNEHLPVPSQHVPVGTNLFSAVEAEQMILHLLEGLPSKSVRVIIDGVEVNL